MQYTLKKQTLYLSPPAPSLLRKFDSLSRLFSEQTPLDVTNYITKSYTYDDNNNLTESKISNNLPGQAASQRKVGYEYDSRNRLVKVNNYEANTIESYIQYEYDAAGNMTAQKTGNGAKITAYAYDNDNRLTSTTDPLNQVESYTYYSNNNLKTKTDRNGQTSTYTYDGTGKLLTTALVSPAGNITKANTYSKTGNLTQQSEQGAQISYQYDNLGRLTNVTDPDGITKTYTYNLNNQATNFQLKQNSVEKLNLTYSYDALDRLNTVKEGSTQIASYGYDQNGNQTSQTFNNGTTSNYTYNKANQILTLSNQKGAAVLSGYAYQYYTDGNAYKITDHNNVVTTYTYDGLGRLKSEAFGSSYSKTYNYDPSNNRSSMAVTGTGARAVSYDYDDNNRLTKETSVSTGITDEYRYVYDPNGNQIAKTKGSITTTGSGVGPTVGAFLLGGPTASGDYEAEVATYDGFNRLVQIKNNGQTIDYAYRPDDLRHSKTINGVKTTHIWDGDNIVLELDNANQVQNRYLRGNGLIAFDNASVRSYYFRNGHSDVVQLTDTTGTVSKDYSYDAFGVETNPVIVDVNPFRYVGEYYDQETESYYLRARNYTPVVGRFTAPDTHWNQINMVFGDTGGTMPSIGAIYQSANLYAYSGNNPILYVDRNGEIWETVLDAASIIWSGADLIRNPSWTNLGYLLWDIGATVVPFAPGSYVAKGGKLLVNTTSRSNDVVKAFNALDKVDRFEAVRNGNVIMAYKDLTKVTKGLGLEVHHLVEKRFDKTLNLKSNDILSIAIDKDAHQKITNMMRDEIPYNSVWKGADDLTTSTATPQQIWDATRRVYKELGYTEYLNPLKQQFIDAGHKLNWGTW